MEKAKFSDLPKFKYHPSPLGTGALIDSEDTCQCCGLARGYMYEGPVYCTEEIDRVCPWCIADGSASAKWNAQFTDGTFFDGHGDYVDLPQEVADEVFRRTIGVRGALQPVRWLVHCEQPAQFLGIEDDRVKFRCSVCGKTKSYRDFD
jgi:uncharacterized protein